MMFDGSEEFDVDLLTDAIAAAEFLLVDIYRVEKAGRRSLNPLKPADFDTIVARLKRKLQGIAVKDQGPALKSALQAIDVDWQRLTPAQRTKAIAAANKSLTRGVRKVVPKLDREFVAEAKNVVTGTRAATRRTLKLKIGAKLNETDKRIIKHVASSQGLYVRNQYGRVLASTSEKARKIVESGLKRGLGSKEIAAELNKSISRIWGDGTKNYLDIIAGVFVNRARTFGQLSSFDEAGITRYEFFAVLDEVTSNVCRFMHGRVFEVGTALRQFQKSEEADDPEDVKKIMPWLREGKDRKTGDTVLYYKKGADGRPVRVATVARSGVGEADDLGKYRKAWTDRQLGKAGVTMPPLHGRCRSTVIPVFD
jgi:SPP1 gp7 family putative phage head morphogenesis protein